MALFKFTKNIIEDRPIDVYNYGDMVRDFTYIEDIVQGFKLAIEANFEFEIFNLGTGKKIPLINFIEIIEQKLGKISRKICCLYRVEMCS